MAVQTTFLPKTDATSPLKARGTARDTKGRIYRWDGTTTVTVTSY